MASKTYNLSALLALGIRLELVVRVFGLVLLSMRREHFLCPSSAGRPAGKMHSTLAQASGQLV